MFNALDYHDGKCTHHEYYSQFVTDDIKQLVINSIGKEAIQRSTDPHLNDIPLVKWDRLNTTVRALVDRNLHKELHNATYGERDKDKFIWSLSEGVCIAKAAARIVKSED